MATPTVAIIVPVLDEATQLAERLRAALSQADELVVSDGGSTDGSREIAASLGARVVSGSPGRGPQLNRGAAATRSEVLLFLHADTSLPPGAVDEVRRAVEEGAASGAFLVRFDRRGVVYRFGERIVDLRTRWTRCPLGDQAQFVRRDVFERLGGFREWPILEDLELARRLRRVGPIAILESRVTTAARRFAQRGPLRTVAINWLIWSLFACGVSPHRLDRFYRKVR